MTFGPGSHLSLAAFCGFSRQLTVDFCASRVANAPRKLRYHQLCSPASLSTEWTQSGSLSSESSFRWIPLVRALSYRLHNSVQSSRLITKYLYAPTRETLYCFWSNAHTWYLLINRAQYPPAYVLVQLKYYRKYTYINRVNNKFIYFLTHAILFYQNLFGQKIKITSAKCSFIDTAACYSYWILNTRK